MDVDVRRATAADVAAIARVELAAQALLAAEGVDLALLEVPDGVDEPVGWALALVAEVEGRVVGSARLTELSEELVALDQVSVDPAWACSGVGRLLLERVVAECRADGRAAITGTTFRDVVFNAPFYARLGCVEDPDPHPVMVERRGVERELGLDALGERVVMRLPL